MWEGSTLIPAHNVGRFNPNFCPQCEKVQPKFLPTMWEDSALILAHNVGRFSPELGEYQTTNLSEDITVLNWWKVPNLNLREHPTSPNLSLNMYVVGWSNPEVKKWSSGVLHKLNLHFRSPFVRLKKLNLASV